MTTSASSPERIAPGDRRGTTHERRSMPSDLRGEHHFHKRIADEWPARKHRRQGDPAPTPGRYDAQLVSDPSDAMDELVRITESLGMYSHQLGARFQIARTMSKLTQADVAQGLGVTQPMIHRYESGEVIPGLGHLRTMAEVCGVSPGWLAFGEGSMVVKP